jgi:hypothetical protein
MKWILALFCSAALAAPPQHLPPETPVTATLTICGYPTEQVKRTAVMGVVLTYPNGEVVRITAENARALGLQSGQEIYEYSMRALDKVVFFIACIDPEKV